MGFLTRLDPFGGLLTKSKKLGQGPQTVWDFPTGVGRSLRPDGCPKKPIMLLKEVEQRSPLKEQTTSNNFMKGI
jgi:hypothetical protein